MLNPLEFFLYSTFILYSLFYKPLLGLIYIALLIIYAKYSKRTFLPTSLYQKSKYTYSNPIEPKFFMRVRYDVTDTLSALKKWNSQNSTKLTLTHVALKALAVGMESIKTTNGRLVFGNFKPEIQSSIGTVIGVKFGKALVPIRIDNAAFKSLQQIQKDMTPVVDLAREQKYQPYHDQMAINKFFPTLQDLQSSGIYATQWVLRYLSSIYELMTSVLAFSLMWGTTTFSPLAHFCHQSLIPCMTNAFQEVVVRNNQIQKRWIVNMCYAFDSRYLEFDQYLHLFFENVKKNMECPQFD